MNLCDNSINLQDLQTLPFPSTLRELQIGSNPLGSKGLLTLTHGLPATLRRLEISNIYTNEWTPYDALMFRTIRFPYFLTWLCLCCNKLTSNAFEHLVLTPYLVSLNLSFNRITNDTLHHLRLPPTLEELLLNNNPSLNVYGVRRLPLPHALVHFKHYKAACRITICTLLMIIVWVEKCANATSSDMLLFQSGLIIASGYCAG